MREVVVALLAIALVASVGALGAGGDLSPGNPVSGTAPPAGQLSAASVSSGPVATSRAPPKEHANATGGSAGTVDDSATLEQAEADSETLTFQFSPGAGGEQSFSAESERSSDDVDLQFASWQNLDTGASGSGTDWTGPGNATYEVTYEASSPVGTPTGVRTFDGVTVSYDSGQSSTDFEVSVVGPEFGTIEIQSGTAVLRGDSGFETTDSFSIRVPNEGDGVLVPDSIEFSGTPSNVELSASLPDQIAGNGEEFVTVDATVGHFVDEDTYQITATVTDNLGNERTYDVGLEVVKPPIVDVRSEPLTLENVTAGRTTTTEIVIEETSGFDTAVEGIQYDLETDDGDVASLEFEDLPDGSLEPGESATANLSVTVDEDVERGRQLSWTLTLAPDDEYELETETEIQGQVRYPARFAAVELDDDAVTYDEPKDRIDVVEDNVTVDLENDGDFALNVTGENVSIDGEELTVVGVDVNNTIEPRSTETAVVNVEGDPEAFEQVLTLEFELLGEDHLGEEVDPARFNESVAIEHETELIVVEETVDFGQVRATDDIGGEIVVGERLGYQDVESFQIERLDGPENDWLTLPETPPETIPAGENVSIPIRLAFGVDAELFTTYEWAFLVSGEEVNASEVVVSGTPEPVNVDPVREDLQGYSDSDGSTGEISATMLEIVDIVEAGVESGDVPRSDIATALSAGRSVALLLAELESAESTIESDGPGAAQESVVRAATAYNTFVLFAEQFEDERLVDRAARIEALAADRIDTLVDQQETQFQRQLDENPSLLQQAELYRQLSQLAVLRGDTERAERLEGDADAAFDAYADRIESGETSFRNARDARNRIESDHALDAFGQPILVNPLNYGAFLSDRRAALDAYDDAESQFREAGATERANTVAAERDRAATELAVTRLSMFVSIGLYGLLAVLLAIHVWLGVRDHRIDRRTVAPDDFLE